MKMENKIIIKDLSELAQNKFPIVVFCDNLRNFLSFGIKKRTKGDYSHVMLMIDKDGKCASQDFTGFNIIDITKKYMKAGFRLKFYSVETLRTTDRFNLITGCLNEAKLPWFKRRYDYLGIIGQFIGFRALNNPKRAYCSEDVIRRLHEVGIASIYPESNPSELNFLLSTDKRFKYIGHWFFD